MKARLEHLKVWSTFQKCDCECWTFTYLGRLMNCEWLHHPYSCKGHIFKTITEVDKTISEKFRPSEQLSSEFQYCINYNLFRHGVIITFQTWKNNQHCRDSSHAWHKTVALLVKTCFNLVFQTISSMKIFRKGFFF